MVAFLSFLNQLALLMQVSPTSLSFLCLLFAPAFQVVCAFFLQRLLGSSSSSAFSPHEPLWLVSLPIFIHFLLHNKNFTVDIDSVASSMVLKCFYCWCNYLSFTIKL